jgi:hypothetical protein
VTGRARLAVLAACAAVVLLAAWWTGRETGPAGPAAPVAAGQVRLGPEPGEPVADYLARLPAELPPPGEPVLALVQYGTGRTAASLAAAAPVTAPVIAVFRVPLPRVQTALRFEPVEPGVPAPTALASAQERARGAAADAGRLTGRAGAVAAAEAAALADPGCPCAVAVLVRADRAALDALAAAPDVRAVHAAPAGTAVRELALAPLLPEQATAADPLPDDGPVPPA